MQFGNSNTLDQWVNDLREQGIMPTDISYTQKNNPMDNDLRVILDLEQRTGVPYSEEQRKILLHRGSACILACAGSGKTTTCIHLIAKRVLTGEIKDTEKLLFTTFSKTGVNEMKTRLDKLFKTLGIRKTVTVRTLHSFFLHLLKEFGVNMEIIKNYERTKYIREACKQYDVNCSDENILAIDTLLSYQVNNLMSDSAVVASPNNKVDGLTLEKYRAIRVAYKDKKASAGVIDYDDMQTYIYLWLVKFAKSEQESERAVAKSVRDYCKALWDDFYIDEAQDISKIQYAIIKEIVAKEDDKTKLDKTLVFIGDDDQAIYQWRGSDPDIILSVAPTFDLTTLVLSTNYRCKSEIVDYATRGVMCNSQRYSKGMSAYNQGGKVSIDIGHSESITEYSMKALAHIKKLISAGESPSDIAVLARNNSHLTILGAQLFKEGIYCNLSSEMKCTGSSLYSDLKKLLELSQGNSYKADNLGSMLWKICRYMKADVSKAIGEVQSNLGLDAKTTLGFILHADDENGRHFFVNDSTRNLLERKVSRISSEHLTILREVYDALKQTPEDCFAKLAQLYQSGTSWMYKSIERIRNCVAMIEYFKMCVKTDGVNKTQEFLRTLEQFEAGNVAVISQTLTLCTVHSAKGREWKHVIMFACDNVSQPNFETCAGLVEKGDIATFNSYIAEERRLFYVGNTRAKDSLLVLTSKSPSIFVLEALGLLPSDSNATLSKFNYRLGVVEKLYCDKLREAVYGENSKYRYEER